MKVKHLFAIAALGTGAYLARDTIPVEFEYSHGTQVGGGVKISRKGRTPFCKTWEGSMGTEIFTKKEDGTTTNAFNFSVPDGNPTILKALQQAQDDNSRVKIEYSQVMKRGSCRSDTDYYVVGVTPVGTAPANAPKPGGM
jgi:hypothetical protein